MESKTAASGNFTIPSPKNFELISLNPESKSICNKSYWNSLRSILIGTYCRTRSTYQFRYKMSTRRLTCGLLFTNSTFVITAVTENDGPKRALMSFCGPLYQVLFVAYEHSLPLRVDLQMSVSRDKSTLTAKTQPNLSETFRAASSSPRERQAKEAK